jgi:hypothetical protein
MYCFRTADGQDRFEISEDQMEILAAMGPYSALLLRRNVEIATGLVSDNYDYPSMQIIDDLLRDQYWHDLHSSALETILRDDELPEININLAALPDSTNDLPYDEILGKLQGALHGAHYLLLNTRTEGYYSPGQVLDISQYLDFCGLDQAEIGNDMARAMYGKLHQLFANAAQRQEAVIFGFVQEDDPEQ